MHEDLLAQATHLASVDRSRPSQVNLRRAVSAAYYALFHALTDSACRSLLGARHEAVGYRNVLARAFTHTAMREACRSFSGGTLPTAIKNGLPSTAAIPPEVRTCATEFIDLQDERHRADYDRSAKFRRSDVLMMIDNAALAIETFEALPSTLDKEFFLACLLAWPTLSKR